MAQVLRKTFFFSAACALAACASGSAMTLTVPVVPEVALTRFMTAVKDNDLAAMSRLWGTSSGPAAEEMDLAELEMRLTVMQAYLTHEEYEIEPAVALVRLDDNVRAFLVRVTRAGCVLQVPFQLVSAGEGWLVSSVDLTQAGNPSRTCN